MQALLESLMKPGRTTRIAQGEIVLGLLASDKGGKYIFGRAYYVPCQVG